MALAALVATTLPISVTEPSSGLDPSWRAGLALAWRNRLEFGREIDFTYGPLGFIPQPSAFYASSARIAVLVLAAVATAYLVALYRVQRKSLGAALALPVAFCLAISLWISSLPFEPLAFAACLGVLRPGASRRRVLGLAVGGGAAAALLLLMKINVGVAVGGMIAVALLCTPARRQAFGLSAASFCATLLTAWLVLGGGLSSLPRFLLHAQEFASGYSTAMSLTGAPLAAGVVAILFVVCLLHATAAWARQRRLAATAVGFLFLFPLLKEGFVRADSGHQAIFFATTLAAVPFMPWSRDERLLQIVVLSLCFVAYAGTLDLSLRRDFNPVQKARSTANGARELLGSGIDRRVTAARDRLRGEYALEGPILAAVQGRATHIEPQETAVAWAYPEIQWRPLPVFQEYTAYTPALDRINADALSSGRAPERVLRRVTGAIDGRLPVFDAPLTQLRLLCLYSTSVVTSAWQVLVPTDDRCSPERPLLTVRGRVGEVVEVPAAGREELVIARIDGAAPLLGEKLLATAYKLRARYLVADGGARYRLVPENAGGPLVLRSGPAADHPGAYAIAPQIKSFKIRLGEEDVVSDRRMRVQFSAVRVASAGPP